jgi:hypothetical protein
MAKGKSKIIPDEVNKNIIKYAFYIYNEYIEKSTLTKYNLSHASFLEIIYRTACDNYTAKGNFELYKDEIAGAYELLRVAEETYTRFNKGEIVLIGIDKHDLLQFNLEPSKSISYDKTKKSWVVDEQDTSENNNQETK